MTLRSLWGDKTGKMAVLAGKVRELNGVEGVIREAIPPSSRAHMSTGAGLQGSDQKPFEVSIYAGNEDYLPFYGMKLMAGRNLLHSDSIREVLINETCAHELGFSDMSEAVGRQIVGLGDKAYPIAGVIADFYENSFHERIKPVVFEHDPRIENSVAIKIASKGMAAGQFRALMGRLKRNGRRSTPKSRLAFHSLMKASPISMPAISKSNGGPVSRIVLMLCRDIVLLILIALLIASPLAWFFMHGWLQGFAYRAALSVWMFAAAGVAAIGIALLTVGFQSIKAASANPVKSLRAE